ncbi:ADP-ribosylation factor 1 [Flagelloscypha sp. PMI_526]|nr:ADP-ribosylation factor 1 [Flagelloscypha sp. PMI_526]
MGHIISKLFAPFAAMKEMRILMVGLDAAGKTTILYKLKLGRTRDDHSDHRYAHIRVTHHPNCGLGFNVESFAHENISFTVWDVSAQMQSRRLWRHYYPNSQAIIYVVDSNDRERISEARTEIMNLVGEEELQDAILLIFANKQDLPRALSADDLTDALELKTISNKIWSIQGTSAITGEGLFEGFEWLAKTLKGMKPWQRSSGFSNAVNWALYITPPV